MFAQISAEERAFLDNEVEKLCEISNEYDFYKKKDLSKYPTQPHGNSNDHCSNLIFQGERNGACMHYDV